MLAQYEICCMVCASVREDNPRALLVDYLPAQTHKPYNNLQKHVYQFCVFIHNAQIIFFVVYIHHNPIVLLLLIMTGSNENKAANVWF